MKLIVGLGNPGKEYENTRHNVGFMIVDNYLKTDDWKEKFKALYHEERINGEKVLFVKPLTFMNLSGDAVVEFVNYYDIDLDDIMVIQDDMDIAFGSFKLKKDSSDGGHNGIKSIINRLGSKNFARLKVGLSHDKSMDTRDYVLGKFSKKDMETFEGMFETYNKVINCFIKDGIERTMNIYNTKSK
ncbi:MAG: aminoacyl-tRNA hydrolase [Bacilli bacterium]|nr:aminoacyl-tRNA hydrolase [Bacilli bacterium]